MGQRETIFRHLMIFRTVFIITFFVFLIPKPGLAAEDPAKFPSKPITLIVPYGAGGTSDTVARKLAELVSNDLGQPVVVENKAGGAGVIGSTAVANAEPDGYTLLITSCSPCLYVPQQRPVSYDSKKDFTYIAQVADFAFAFAVREDSAIKSFKDFISEARKNSGKLTYQSQGPKSAGHVQMEYIFSIENVKVRHVPGKGAAEVITQLLGGHVDGGITAGLWPQMKAGKLRGLAIAGEQRNSSFPDIPTFNELGYEKGIPYGCAVGILGPAGMNPQVTKKLDNALKKAVFDPTYKELLSTMMEMQSYKSSDQYKEASLKSYDAIGVALNDLGLKE